MAHHEHTTIASRGRPDPRQHLARTPPTTTGQLARSSFIARPAYALSIRHSALTQVLGHAVNKTNERPCRPKYVAWPALQRTCMEPLPTHLASTTAVNAVERLRCLAALPTHRRSTPLRTLLAIVSGKVVRAVIQVRCFVNLFVAHAASPFRIPFDGIISGATCTHPARTQAAPCDRRLLPSSTYAIHVPCRARRQRPCRNGLRAKNLESEGRTLAPSQSTGNTHQ